MYKNSCEITEDGFGIHTFELTIPYITKEEFERIGMNAEKSYINNDKNSICIFAEIFHGTLHQQKGYCHIRCFIHIKTQTTIAVIFNC